MTCEDVAKTWLPWLSASFVVIDDEVASFHMRKKKKTQAPATTGYESGPDSICKEQTINDSWLFLHDNAQLGWFILALGAQLAIITVYSGDVDVCSPLYRWKALVKFIPNNTHVTMHDTDVLLGTPASRNGIQYKSCFKNTGFTKLVMLTFHWCCQRVCIYWLFMCT